MVSWKRSQRHQRNPKPNLFEFVSVWMISDQTTHKPHSLANQLQQNTTTKTSKPTNCIPQTTTYQWWYNLWWYSFQNSNQQKTTFDHLHIPRYWTKKELCVYHRSANECNSSYRLTKAHNLSECQSAQESNFQSHTNIFSTCGNMYFQAFPCKMFGIQRHWFDKYMILTLDLALI